MTMKEFVNPKSMLTPGVAGGIAMLIANSLWLQFSLEPRWTGLILSFMFGLLVFAAIEIAWWQRIIYWFLNSLLIFSIGFSAHAVGSESRHVVMTQMGPRPGADPAPERNRPDVNAECVAQVRRFLETKGIPIRDVEIHFDESRPPEIAVQRLQRAVAEFVRSLQPARGSPVRTFFNGNWNVISPSWKRL